MKLIVQILPYVKKALRQNNNDSEAKELIRQIEMNSFTTTNTDEHTLSMNTGDSQQYKQMDNKLKLMQSKIEKLEEELADMKANYDHDVMCL